MLVDTILKKSILVLWVSFFILFKAHDVQAQATVKPYTGIDLLLVIDQSGSMGGEEFGTPGRTASDPTQLRFQIQQLLLGTMSDISYYALPDEGTVRMAAIAFGSPQREITLDWRELAPPGLSEDDWRRQTASMQELLRSEFFGKINFIYTDFSRAFELAQEMFDKLPSLPATQRNLRVILVVTDGEPCLFLGCPLDSGKELLEKVRALTPGAFPDPDYRLYLVAINGSLESDPGRSYWDEYGPYWNDIIGTGYPVSRTHLIDTSADMKTAVDTVVEDLLTAVSNIVIRMDVDLIDGRGTAFVLPYLSQVSFEAFNPSTTPKLTLLSPLGPLDETDPEVLVSGTTNIQIWHIEVPEPGIWNVAIDPPDAGVHVAYQQIALQSTLAENGGSYSQWQRVPLNLLLYTLNDDKPRRVTLRREYPILVQGKLASSVTSTQNITLTAGDKGYQDLGPLARDPQYSGEFVPLTPGDYQLTFKGTVDPATLPATAPNPYMPLNMITKDAYHLKIRPASVGLEYEWTSGNWLQTVAVPVCVRVTDGSLGTDIPDLGLSRVHVTVRDASTQAEVQGMDLNARTDPNDKCAFRGSLAPTTPGASELWLTGYVPDDSGSEIEVFQRTRAEHSVVVDPIQYVSLKVLQPPANDVTQNERSTTPFWVEQPFVAQVQAVTADGQPFDLAAYTDKTLGADPVIYTLTDSAQKPAALGEKLQYLSGSSYTLSLPKLYQGRYTLTFTGQPLDSVACRCAYDLNGGERATRVFTREFPIVIVLQILAFLAVVAAIAAGLVWTYVNWVRQRKNPLSGIVLGRFYESFNQSEQELTPIDLSQYSRNTVKIKGRELGLPPQVKTVFITNHGYNPNSELWKTGRIEVKVQLQSPYPTASGRLDETIQELKLFEDTKAGVTYILVYEPS